MISNNEIIYTFESEGPEIVALLQQSFGGSSFTVVVVEKDIRTPYHNVNFVDGKPELNTQSHHIDLSVDTPECENGHGLFLFIWPTMQDGRPTPVIRLIENSGLEYTLV